MCPLMRANTENTSTGGLLPPVDFLYIASLLNRHGISCNPCHAVKARHCLVCHAAPRVMVPDSRGCGSVRVRDETLPVWVIVRRTQRSAAGTSHPRRASPRDLWMIVACDRFAYPLVKENSISHFPAETRFQTSEPHIPGRLPTLEPALDVGYLQLVICRDGGK